MIGIPGIMPASAVADGGLERIARIADPQRARRLDAYERLYKGKAYEGRPSFWDSTVPLHERAPIVCGGVAESAGGRLASMVFGNRVFPNLTVSDGDADIAVNPEQQALLSALANRLVKVASLRVVALTALTEGLSVGTSVAHVAVVRGRPVVTLLPAKWCTPTFAPTGALASVEERYRYDAPGPDGRMRTWWYRRVIDAARDVAYQPAPVREDGREPVWIEDPERTVTHELGFCPVVWHRNRPEVSESGIDGTPLFAGLEDEIEALDMALSQRHRNGRYNGEPQMVVVGADADKPLAEGGRTAQPIPQGAASWFSAVKDAAGKWFTGNSGTGGAFKKAPNKVWKIPQGGDAKLLESSGAGAQILTADIDGLRRAILEARQIVIASPETISANASAALMREIYAPMISVADTYREEYGAWLCELVNLTLRVCSTVAARPGAVVLLRGLREAAPLLSLFSIEVDGGAEWVGLPFELKWGPYFPPMPADIVASVNAATTACGMRPVLSQRSAVALVAAMVDIDDVDAELAAIEGGRSADQATLEAADTPAAVVADGASTVADTALNGAQVTSLVEILSAVAAGTLPIETAKPLILAAFPSFDDARVESMLSPLRNRIASPAPAAPTSSPSPAMEPNE